MRRIAWYELFVVTVAVMVMSGCSDSSLPDLADSTNTTFAELDETIQTELTESSPTNAETDVALPERPNAFPLPPNSDSDTPGAYKPPQKANNSTHDHEHAPAEAGATPKQVGPRADEDDPQAPLVVSKAAPQDEVPLNNGREPAAKPLPVGQRVEVETPALTPDSDGRSKGAQPGDVVPTKADPTVKPAPPSKATLADVSESVQELDKDGDGQLGLYEWPRQKLAEFKTLDSNQDGFLTAAELLAGAKKTSDPTPKTGDTPKKTDEAKTDEAKKNGKDANNEKAQDEAKKKDVEKTDTKSDAPAPPEDAKTPAAKTTEKSTTTDKPAEGTAEQDATVEKDSAVEKDRAVEDNPTPGS